MNAFDAILFISSRHSLKNDGHLITKNACFDQSDFNEIL